MKLLAEKSGKVGSAFLLNELDAIGELEMPELIVQVFPDAFDGIVTVRDVPRLLGNVIIRFKPV